MLKELYDTYKSNFENYIILIRNGNFFVCLNDDAMVMNEIFKYKMNESTNFIKVGFPATSLNRIRQVLINRNVNYIVYDKVIIDKQKFKNNCYRDYLRPYTSYEIYLNRIKMIDEILKNNLAHKDISKILSDIESLLCKIN